MRELTETLRWVQLAAFVGLAVVCLRVWRRHPTAAAAWVATTFGILGLVAVVGAFAGPDGASLPDWLTKPLVVLIVLFPYFLHRFMSALAAPPRWVNRAALLSAVLIAGWTFLLPSFPEPGEPLGPAFRAYTLAITLQWTALSLSVSVRLWRAGRGEPGLPRRRMRLLAVAALGLNLAVVVSGASGGERPDALRAVTQLLGLASAGFFYVAFAPPRTLRTLWRREDEQALQRAATGLSAATSMEDVTSALLPHVAPIFGGNGGLLAGPDGAMLGVFGMGAREAERIGRELAAGSGARLEPSLMALPLRSGWLVVRGTAFTPFFGRDELDLLASIASFVDLAIERAALFGAERAAREDLERANTELEAFLYSVSHDLKSPLVSLSGYLGYVQQDYKDVIGPQGREYLDRMAANAAYMEDLIQDLLELSRVGRILTEPSETDLVTVIDDIATQIRDAHPEVGIEVGEVPAVLMNPVRARQLFTNLLDNAVTHGGRPDLHIRISARETADGVEISVVDDGAGIPEGYREKVFGVFERLESRRGKGTGIGLAICRKIVDHLGGRIWIAGSEQGTDVRIQIPPSVVRGWTARVAT